MNEEESSDLWTSVSEMMFKSSESRLDDLMKHIRRLEIKTEMLKRPFVGVTYDDE